MPKFEEYAVDIRLYVFGDRNLTAELVDLERVVLNEMKGDGISEIRFLRVAGGKFVKSGPNTSTFVEERVLDDSEWVPPGRLS